jgi:hypothetical protein
VRALSELARFYNSQNRPESALRHIAKAQQISEGLETDTDGLALAIEIADANLQSKHTSRQEGTRQVNAADSALSPYAEAVIDDVNLAYRRDLLLARIKARKRNFRDAFVMYENAAKSLSELNGGAANATTASLYMELGTTAEQAKDGQRAGCNFLKAYRIFVALKMPDSAKMIESKLPADADAVSEEEEAASILEAAPSSDAHSAVPVADVEPAPQPEPEPVGEEGVKPEEGELKSQTEAEGAPEARPAEDSGDAASATAPSHGPGEGETSSIVEEEEPALD